MGKSSWRRAGESMTIERSAIRRLGDRFGVKKPGVGALAKLAGLAAVLFPLPGCQSLTGSPSLSQVRIIDASPDAPGLDVYQGASVLAYNLGLGTVTSYVPIAPGGYAINVDVAGTRQQLVTASGTFLPNAQYTVLVGNFEAALQELILKDQTTPAPANEIALRFINQSVRTGPLDVYLIPSGSTLVGTKPILTDFAFNTNTGYMNIPGGTYTLVAVPTGTVPTATGTTLYTGGAVAYPYSSAETLVLIDSPLTTAPAIQVLTAVDYSPID
jgi:hypothetical protein